MRTIRIGSPEYRLCLEALILANDKEALLALKEAGNKDLCILNEGDEQGCAGGDKLLLIHHVATDGRSKYQVIEKDEVITDPIYIAGEGVVFVLPNNHRD